MATCKGCGRAGWCEATFTTEGLCSACAQARAEIAADRAAALEKADAAMAASMTVQIVPGQGRIVGKLAEAELHFSAGPLAGLKLAGFAVWEGRGRDPRRRVTFPARKYQANGGGQFTFAVLRPIEAGEMLSSARIRDLILEAYDAHEARQGAVAEAR